METILKLSIWLVFIAAFIAYQWYVIERKKKRPFYLFDFFVIKGPAFILYGVYVWDFQNRPWYLNILIWCIVSFWILLDLFLNVSRGKPWNHVGEESGWIDEAGTKLPWLYWLLKLVALITLIWTTINILNH